MIGLSSLQLFVYSFYKLLDGFFAFVKYFALNSWIFTMHLFKAFDSLVYIKYIVFVPMLCSLVLVVSVMHFFKYISFVPLLDFISLMQLRCVFVSVKYWTCK